MICKSMAPFKIDNQMKGASNKNILILQELRFGTPLAPDYSPELD